jgi:predicted DNA-binding transcriptional regulator AlpA
MQPELLNDIKLLNERQAAAFLGIAVDTIRHWRLKKRGPVCIRLGGAIRYRMADLMAYIDSCPTGPASRGPRRKADAAA